MDVTGAIPTVVSGYDWRHGNNEDYHRSLSDIRMEVKESESVLLRTAAANAAVSAKESSDSTFRLHENIRNVADQILVSSTMTQADIAASNAATSAQFAVSALAQANNTAAIILASEKQTASILAALSATELRQLQDELNETRLQRTRFQSEVNFGNQFSVLQSQINSLDQIQRSTNQAINFGTGTIGAQSSTQNQVR